jgi:competence protein ComEA
MSHHGLLLPTIALALCGAVLQCNQSPVRAQASTPTSADSPSSDAVRAPPTSVVNINSASAEELERLPGIGPARARAILQLRAQRTRFKRIEELLRVKGIGRATFRKLRPMLSLDGPTTLSSEARRSTH